MGIQLCQVLGNATQSEVGDVGGGTEEERESLGSKKVTASPCVSESWL